MRSHVKDEFEGKLHQAKGKAKEVVGNLRNDPKREAEGKAEHTAGKVQEKIGQIKKVVGK